MMAKHFNSQSRVFLDKDACHNYFKAAQENLQISQRELSQILGISTRTFTAWKTGTSSFPYNAVRVLKKKAKIALPPTATIEENPYWYTFKGAQLGAKKVHELYGDHFANTPYRRKQWLLWWEEKGRHISAIGKRKSINTPPHSPELAEFVGIMLGDGGITKYQIKITLHSIDDIEYSLIVLKLIKNFLASPPQPYCQKTAKRSTYPSLGES